MRSLIQMTKRKALTLGAVGIAALGATAALIRQPGTPARAAEPDQPNGLLFRLSEGKASTGSDSVALPAPAEKLTDAEAEQLLSRLPLPKVQPGDVVDFALRESSLAAPRAGKTVPTAFPPPAPSRQKPTVETGPLSVRRMSPEGDVAVADRVSVTFSQPMIPVTSQTDAAKLVPVTLSPEVPGGGWRWLGTQTLIYDMGQGRRLPAATEYTLTVPAGAKSQSGNALGKAEKLVFRTPTVQLLQSAPGSEAQPLQPTLWLIFDQKIDPDAVLKTMALKAGEKKFGIRLASAAEKLGSPYRYMGSGTPAERVLAVRPIEPLPGGTNFSVEVGPGTPSAEGPRKTDSAQSFSFSTYGPLQKTDALCGWSPDEVCRPETPWHVSFTNPLDAESFDPSWVSITPKAPGVEAQVSGTQLIFQGLKKGRTSYKVTISKNLKDVFGQTLTKEESVQFIVKDSLPYVQCAAPGFFVADPSGGAALPFRSVNVPYVKLKVYAVSQSDWSDWLKWQNAGPRRGDPPGRLLDESNTKLLEKRDEWADTELPLKKWLPGGRGNLVIVWESPVKRRDEDRDRGALWVQATKIGLSAHADNTDLYGWATNLADGKPLPGVTLSLIGGGQKATTDAGGLAHLTLSDQPGKRLVAKSGDDEAFLPGTFWEYEGEGAWRKSSYGSSLRWFVFDDRKLYKPGETVKIKGWIRRGSEGKTGDLTLSGVKSVRWILRDSRGNETGQGTASVNAWGGFDLSLTLGKTYNLGQANVQLLCDEGNWNHAFDVQEFRKPEFEVSAKSESAGPHVIGGAGAELSVGAKYYAGGPLPGAKATWTVSASPSSYSPPGHEAFTFGTWTPWWGNFGGGDDFDGGFVSRRGFPGRPGRNETRTFEGLTDGGGVHRLHIDLDGVKPARPYSLSANAAVMDVNRQAWAAQTSVLVHPSERYVGLRGKKLFVQKGKPLALEFLACDIDGKVQPGVPVKFVATRKEGKWQRGRYKEIVAEKIEWSATSEAKPATTEFSPKEGGQWTVSATVLDGKERPNTSELTLWVTGGKPQSSRDLNQQAVTLIPSKKEYAPGETAEVLAQLPFFPAEGLVTVRRQGIVSVRRVSLKDGTYTISVPITDAQVPNTFVQLDLVGAASRTLDDGTELKNAPKRPAFASGQIGLSVSTAKRKLTVVATPTESKLEPGGTTTISVSVKDSDGKPVSGGEAAVAVVDESVLALAGWSLGDPIAAFYPPRGPNASDWHLRSYVRLSDPTAIRQEAKNRLRFGAPGGSAGGGRGGFVDDMRAMDSAMVRESAAPAPMSEARPMRRMLAKKTANSEFDKGESSEGGEAGSPIRLRENFEALAVFAASVKTDSDGIAKVEVKLPDNLTRYRIVAVAVEGEKRAGTGEGNLTARLPLMARPSAPRFLNFGDKFELPVVIQNQTDAPMTVSVAVRATNATLTDGKGRRVTVPANDRVEVRFPTEAARPGTARFQVAASSAGSGSFADAAEVSLPVWTPATTEAFATYGVLDNGAIAQPVKAPSDVQPGFGGLEVTTSSTALQELTDAYIYLAEYPYGCAEQISSRVLTSAALKDVLAAFQAPGMPDAKALSAAMARDLARLEELQNSDGSYGFWIRGERPWPYLGVHAAHALVRAKQKDFAVPDAAYKRSMDYVKNIESKFPSDYPESCKRSIRAYALYVRNLAGDTDRAKTRQLLSEKSLAELGPEIVGWLLPTLTSDPESGAKLAEIRKWLSNKATETAGAAHFSFSYGDGAYFVLASDRRADGIVLDALIADQPKSDLIPKLVRGLLDGRKKGAWGNTQENCFILLALDRYFRTYEGVTPNFVARLWLGEKFAGEGSFKGRTTDRVATNVPMKYLLDQPNGSSNLTIGKEGAGRLYYRIGMKYAPKSLQLAPADYGFAVGRTYEAIDKPTDVRREADGTWVVKAGAKVRVKVSMVATTRRYHVALVDPLPAGFEALNPELRGTDLTGSPMTGGGGGFGGRGGWWWWHWYEHTNLRDERAEAFASYLWEGAYEFTYVCRATTPGNFVVPPTKAEEMYSPETFGRSGSDRVKVE